MKSEVFRVPDDTCRKATGANDKCLEDEKQDNVMASLLQNLPVVSTFPREVGNINLDDLPIDPEFNANRSPPSSFFAAPLASPPCFNGKFGYGSPSHGKASLRTSSHTTWLWLLRQGLIRRTFQCLRS
jgi:hypothetical protein